MKSKPDIFAALAAAETALTDALPDFHVGPIRGEVQAIIAAIANARDILSRCNFDYATPPEDAP